MAHRSITCLLAVGTALLGISVGKLAASELYGNFHTLGVVLDLPAGYRPAQIGEVRLFQVEEGRSARLHDPVLVRNGSYYVGSVFHLRPGTQYQIRAEFIDAAGKVVHRELLRGQTRSEPAEPPAALREIHVSKDGDDKNPGTINLPKKSLAAALQSANRAGTHVVVHRGIYYEGDLPAVGKGTAAAPIVVRAAKGEIAIIDGSDLAVLKAKWKDLGNGYYSTPFTRKTWTVCVEHVKTGRVRRLYPIGSKENLLSKKVGRYRFDTFHVTEAYHCTGSEIVIYCPYFKPGEMVIHVSRRGKVVEHSNCNHIVYSDLTVRFFDGQAFYINDSSDITFRRCSFQYNNLPIAVKRASHRLLVERCRFVDDCTRWGFLPKGMDDLDYAAYIETGMIYTYNPYEGRGMVVRNNVIDGLFDGVNLTPMGPPSKVRTHETDFYNNHILKVCDDLIEADGQCSNLRIFGNRMENYLSGISIAQGYGGPTYVIYNVLLGAGKSTAAGAPTNYEGYPVKTNGGTRHGTTGIAYFYHNTCHTTAPNTNAFRVQAAQWRKLVFANNIWQGTRDGFVFWRREISPIDMTNDLVFPETGVLLKIVKEKYASKSEAEKARPFFSSAIVANPSFADIPKGNVQLLAGSPAIDAGVIIPGINDERFKGEAPDIGAFEYSR